MILNAYLNGLEFPDGSRASNRTIFRPNNLSTHILQSNNTTPRPLFPPLLHLPLLPRHRPRPPLRLVKIRTNTQLPPLLKILQRILTRLLHNLHSIAPNRESKRERFTSRETLSSQDIYHPRDAQFRIAWLQGVS